MGSIVTICGEVHSENLGDMVIAQCTRHLIHQANPMLDVRQVDLSGRQGGAQRDESASLRRRASALRGLCGCVTTARSLTNLIRWEAGLRDQLTRYWDEAMCGSSLILLGGGQLLLDNDLRFPLCVREVRRVADRIGAPVAFFACGVEEHWSWLGRRMLRDALLGPNVIDVSVRDSHRQLVQLVPELRETAWQTWDPAIVCSDAFGLQRRRDSNVIGLGVMASRALQRHPASIRGVNDECLVRFWRDSARELSRRGHRVAIFTNGSMLDQVLAAKVAASINEMDHPRAPAVLMDRPTTPYGLVQMISQFRGVLAYRLHASLIAYSLAIPFVALAWDNKLHEFAGAIGRPDLAIPCLRVQPEEAVAKLEDALHNGPDFEQVVHHKRLVSSDVRELLKKAGLAVDNRTRQSDFPSRRA